MTITKNLGNCYILTGEVDGQTASVYLLDNPDRTTTVVNEITTRINLIRQCAADLCILQQRLQELTEQ